MNLPRKWWWRTLEGHVTPHLTGMLVLLPRYPFLEDERGSQSGLLVELAFSALIALGVIAVAIATQSFASGSAAAAGCLVESLTDGIPIHNIPPCLDVSGSSRAVLLVVGMLPHIEP